MKCVVASMVGLCAAASLVPAQEATTRVSVDSAGQIADYYCSSGAVSASGRFVAFESRADNLVPNDTNGYVGDVFVRDRDPDGDGVLDDAHGVTTCMSLDPSGLVGDMSSGAPSISADGRYVAFSSYADNLVANDTNGFIDVFVRDRDPDGNGIFDEGNGVTWRVNVGANGAESDGWSSIPGLSADGRYVVFESSADDLVANDTNLSNDVFVFDRDPDGNGIFDEGNGVTARMSIRADGVEANNGSGNARISANGRHVSFESTATNLVANDTNGHVDVFVHDRDPDGNGIFDEGSGAMARLSVSSSGVQGNGNSHYASISGDGRHVAFLSTAINLVSGDTNSSDDVFAHDRDPDGNGVFDEGNGVTTRVSVKSSGAQGNGNCGFGAISGDGRIVAFDSSATNLVPNDANLRRDVFTRDRDPDGNGILDEGNGVTARVSVNSCDFESDGDSYADAISQDGRWVVFASYASNLVADGIGGFATEIFVRDRAIPPPDASWNNYGTGYPGTLGVPALTASANPVIGTSLQIDVGNSLGTWTVGLVLIGASQANAPTNDGGTLLVTWNVIVPLVVWPGGSAWSADVPDDWTLCHDSAFLQVIEFDAGAQFGLSFSQGLELIVGR